MIGLQASRRAMSHGARKLRRYAPAARHPSDQQLHLRAGAGNTVSIHICRGNARSTWLAERTYEELADTYFALFNVDRFLLEYDDARRGSFAPLRFMPDGKQVVLGLVTTKHARLEDKDALKLRLDAAAKLIDSSLLAPACNAASPACSKAISSAKPTSAPS